VIRVQLGDSVHAAGISSFILRELKNWAESYFAKL